MSAPVPPDAPRLLSVVEELEGLLAKATEGSWDAVERVGRPDTRIMSSDARWWCVGDTRRSADADLIVAAVNNLPRLLAAARLAATLQDHQEQTNAAMDALWETARRQGQQHDPTTCPDGCGFCALIIAVHAANAIFAAPPSSIDTSTEGGES